MENAKILLGRRIRYLRNLRGMTQEQLGTETDLSYKYLGSIERGGKNPSIDNLQKIAQALKVELYELFIFDHETDDIKELKKQIDEMLKGVGKKEYRAIYRVIKAIMK
ncbi:MAG: HTH-type transcriptional regulator SinR [Smithella sp. PtaU1.Bin162]|nr:MAG: HTH-type transcriptional regulator SinR [Smithella sp. PtaU1.Bin162]